MKKVLLYCVVSIMLFGYVLPTYSQYPGGFPYSPSKYGVPKSVGGYVSLAVIPSANIPCAIEGHLKLILESEISGVENFIKQSRGASIQSELQQLDITKSVVWDVSVVSPNTTESEIIASVNEANRTHNGVCDQLKRLENNINNISKPIEVGTNNQEFKFPSPLNGY